MHACSVYICNKRKYRPKNYKISFKPRQMPSEKTLFIKTQPVVVGVQCVYWVQEEPVALYHWWCCSPAPKPVFYALFCCRFHHLPQWLSSALHRAARLNPLRLAWRHTGLFARTQVLPPFLTIAGWIGLVPMDICLFAVLFACCFSVCYTVNILRGEGRRLGTQKGNRASVVSCRYLWIHCSRK